jgi:4-diphosphocytidyl-2C-methyl-D-erythritol kinase
MFQEFLRANGATVALMSGSGSTTFALTKIRPIAEDLSEKFKARFGQYSWTAIAELT